MPFTSIKEQRKYQREWMQARRSEWVKAHGPCQECGSAENLEIDHIDPFSKLIKPGQIWGRRKKVREAELAKCQVLCNECHAKKSVIDLIARSSRGENRPSSKLTNEQVIEIRMKRLQGETYRLLAECYQVHFTTIGQICRRERWTHI